MAEAQMGNTIAQRVARQQLHVLHQDNVLGFRFPIGKMDQVKHPGQPVSCALQFSLQWPNCAGHKAVTQSDKCSMITKHTGRELFQAITCHRHHLGVYKSINQSINRFLLCTRDLVTTAAHMFFDMPRRVQPNMTKAHSYRCP